MLSYYPLAVLQKLGWSLGENREDVAVNPGINSYHSLCMHPGELLQTKSACLLRLNFLEGSASKAIGQEDILPGRVTVKLLVFSVPAPIIFPDGPPGATTS